VTVSEVWLARKCHTYAGGTENWYLARSLRRRGLSVAYMITEPDPPLLPCPSLAGVGVGGERAGHFITVLEKTPAGYVIGDALIGRITVPPADLRNRYHFTGFFMVIS
jgi:hypothetical protein